ncbi:MAG: hypothetical protein DBY36_07350 [Clostridiales bacterium]|nr:MAG: hypothetical protein DBY36_07350 [Clostridiales bacterium]
MKDRTKNIVVTILFPLLLIGFLAAFLCKPAAEISVSERRKLDQAPKLTLDAVLNGQFFSDFEDYTLDQFPLREEFRTLSALYRFRLMQQKDNNKIYLADGSIFKLEYPMNEKYVVGAADKLNSLYDKYLSGMNVYFSIIPDKNYFAAESNGYPSLDYEQLEALMLDNVKNMTYIDLFSALSLSDYYKTDTHWRQEALTPVLEALGAGMGFDAPPLSGAVPNSFSPFYGVYYGQSALPVGHDTLTYLTTEATEAATVYNYETNRTESVYTLEKLDGLDPYDVFLGGAAPLLKIESPHGKPGRELILFRDSFGSSLTPLLLEEYSEIWLVDIRYMHSDLLEQYIEFDDQDVLFLYSTLVINNSPMLK